MSQYFLYTRQNRCENISKFASTKRSFVVLHRCLCERWMMDLRSVLIAVWANYKFVWVRQWAWPRSNSRGNWPTPYTQHASGASKEAWSRQSRCLPVVESASGADSGTTWCLVLPLVQWLKGSEVGIRLHLEKVCVILTDMLEKCLETWKICGIWIF